MSGKRIDVRMQNLDRDFMTIKAQLDGILENYYGMCAV